ncbi:MAG: monofunctional biosynthetic peptidoglycan transglycosylase [Parvularculaceae bacterium]|nr:monofunctional biosynthetic peptidoglycan transglycosylase [Parvularculaceae bacterium]
MKVTSPKLTKAGARRAAGLGARAFGWVIVIAGLSPVLGAAVYRFAPPPGTFLMLDRALNGVKVRNDWAPLEEISPHLVRAVIAAEDSRYCQHAGIDVAAIKDAAEHNKKNGKRRGGSTISQQTAKNVFLWNGGGYVRKGLEAWFTLVSETIWGKRRTMELYLNVAEWGDGYFGAEAAARGRFGKSAKDLTKQEAALLAAVLPSPNKWRAVNPGPYVRGRAATIRKRMEIVRRDSLDQCVLQEKTS